MFRRHTDPDKSVDKLTKDQLNATRRAIVRDTSYWLILKRGDPTLAKSVYSASSESELRTAIGRIKQREDTPITGSVQPRRRRPRRR